eukprot:175544_1
MESEDNDRTGSTREKTEPEEYLVGDENPPHPLGLEEELHEVLPPFANEENRLLDAEVKERSKKLEQVDNQLGDQRERISIMKDHLRNVEQEMLHTQALCQAKENEIETEDHLKRLAERELERTDADKRKIEKEIGDIQNKLNNVHNQIFSSNEKLEQFKLRMNWNQEELDNWALASKQKEDDYMALLRWGSRF